VRGETAAAAAAEEEATGAEAAGNTLNSDLETLPPRAVLAIPGGPRAGAVLLLPTSPRGTSASVNWAGVALGCGVQGASGASEPRRGSEDDAVRLPCREAERARFRTEAETVARLQHPNVVQVFEVGEWQGEMFLALEFCPGGTLDGKLRVTGPMPPVSAASLVRDLARACRQPTTRGVVHRDLKPANVLLAGGRDAKDH